MIECCLHVILLTQWINWYNPIKNLTADKQILAITFCNIIVYHRLKLILSVNVFKIQWYVYKVFILPAQQIIMTYGVCQGNSSLEVCLVIFFLNWIVPEDFFIFQHLNKISVLKIYRKLWISRIISLRLEMSNVCIVYIILLDTSSNKVWWTV